MPRRRSNRLPFLVFANSAGEILEHPELLMTGSSCGRFFLPESGDLIELPEGSDLFVLPGRLPVGADPHSSTPLVLEENPYSAERPQAVAAFMAPAHTAIYTAAYRSLPDAPVLPLFAYTAVGWQDGKFMAAGFRSDPDPRQDAGRFDQHLISSRTKKMLREYPANRLIQHLGKCCLTYCCPAARNYFLGRWEAPLPTSPVCNASCAGCISLQPSGCCPATQDRIAFVPTPAEISEIAVPHLRQAASPIVSFGQGCEGEPLLQAAVIEQAIKRIRTDTGRGTINLNTNGSLPEAVGRLIRAGLDSIRVSLNSARPEFYTRYYRPKGYAFDNVLDTICRMQQAGRHVSLNYFILPGFTDDPDEFNALCDLIDRCRPDLIQLRNLNMDPELYCATVKHTPSKPPMGIRNWHASLKNRFPALRYGYFNPALK